VAIVASRAPGRWVVRRLASVASKLQAPEGRKIIAQGKRSAALGNGVIMNIPLSSWSALPARWVGRADHEERG